MCGSAVTEPACPVSPRLAHHASVEAEIPRASAYPRADWPLRLHAATSSAHSAALRRAAFARPRPLACKLVVFGMARMWWPSEVYALRQAIRRLRYTVSR